MAGLLIFTLFYINIYVSSKPHTCPLWTPTICLLRIKLHVHHTYIDMRVQYENLTVSMLLTLHYTPKWINKTHTCTLYTESDTIPTYYELHLEQRIETTVCDGSIRRWTREIHQSRLGPVPTCDHRRYVWTMYLRVVTCDTFTTLDLFLGSCVSYT